MKNFISFEKFHFFFCKFVVGMEEWNVIVKKVSDLSKKYFTPSPDESKEVKPNVKCSKRLNELSNLIAELARNLDEQVWVCSQVRGKYVVVIYWKHDETLEPLEKWVESQEDKFSGGESDPIFNGVISLQNLKRDIQNDSFRNLHDVGWYRGTEEIFIKPEELESLDVIKKRKIDYSMEIEDYVRKNKDDDGIEESDNEDENDNA